MRSNSITENDPRRGLSSLSFNEPEGNAVTVVAPVPEQAVNNINSDFSIMQVDFS